MTSSISFDHAADFYDATRALNADVSRALTSAIVREMSGVGAERLLEIGVGTGRIARPLASAGVQVCGIDVAPRMLARLREQLGGGDVAPDLMLGDATHLPLRNATFAAAVAVHVLHLIPRWPEAVAELARVLRRPGIVMHFRTRYEDERGPEEDALWDGMLSQRGFKRRRRPKWEEIQEAHAAVGGKLRTEHVARTRVSWSPAKDFAAARKRVHSWTWEIPEDLFFECLPLYEAWAIDRYGDPELERVDKQWYELEIWTFVE